MEQATINQVMARAFINSLSFALTLDQTPQVMGDVKTKEKFRLLTDAQLSVLFSLSNLITDENEVLNEYDKLTEMLKLSSGAPQEPLVSGRTVLLQLLESGRLN